MDPVTHAVIGMSIAKAAGHDIQLTDPVTAGILIGSVFPDIDILMQKWGDYVYLKNHRGASHSIIGLFISAVLAAGVMKFIYHDTGMLSLFMWTMTGFLSHSIFDLFNTYGAMIFWPFSQKRFTFGLLVVFDPIFSGLLSAYSFTGNRTGIKFLYSLALYILIRVLMRSYVKNLLVRKFRSRKNSIRLLPSVTGIFRWHFILEKKRCRIVGEKNIITQKIRIFRKLYKLQDNKLGTVMNSSVGTFFKEFTPVFHVVKEKTGSLNRYIFIDLRYVRRNRFLHHAVIDIDGNSSIIRQSFNPYSINRINKIKC